MKAKIKLLESISVLIVIIVIAYFFGVKGTNLEYKSLDDSRSTANYIEMETIDDVKNLENLKIDNDIAEETNNIEENSDVIEESVYDGKTADELIAIINKSLSSTIANKGELIVLYSLEMGVDPYLATAIILHETGCKWNCSRLVRECNNVGGQKGTGCGSYSYFNSLDEGIKAFINNLSKNYISLGLTTPEEINKKYAEDKNWATNVSKYIEIIKAQ